MKKLANMFLLIAALSIVKFCLADLDQNAAPVVQTKQGLVSGSKDISLGGKEFFSYMSIPYAKPPVGELRFKDPVPIDRWEGTLNGTRMPDYCPQYHIFYSGKKDKSSPEPLGKEDCLYLNIYTAKPNLPESNRAVMVFIHGGGFIFGGADEYPPHVLMNEDIVLVVIQYRLGVFGFLSTEDSALPGNLGLKDQQRALKWIQENIIHFGGDPKKVTLFGESAGGASVHFQVLSPGSKGLFQRGILQSGTAISPWATVEHHRAFAATLGNEVHCPLKNDSSSFVECLRKVDERELLYLSTKNTKQVIAPLYVLPRVDGEFLPDYPETLIREHRYNKVDLISGKTRDEGALFMHIMHLHPEMRRDLQENFNEAAPYSLTVHDEHDAEEIAHQIYRRYLNKRTIIMTSDDDPSLVKMFSDADFGVPHDYSSLFHSEDEELSYYMYELNYEGKTSILDMVPNLRKNNWISHLDDLVYLFSGGPLFSQPLTDEEDLKFREIMVSLWVNFAKTGNPTPPSSNFIWEKVQKGDLRFLNLIANPKMEKYNFEEERKFWSSLKLKRNQRLFPKHEKKSSMKNQNKEEEKQDSKMEL